MIADGDPQEKVRATITIRFPRSHRYEGWPLTAPLDTAYRGRHPIDWNLVCWIPVGSKYVPTEEARDLFLGEVLLLDWRWPSEQGEFCRGAPPEEAREIARLIRIFEFPLTVGVAWGRWYEGMPLYGAIGRFWHGDAKLVAVHGPEGVVPVFAENPPPGEDEDEDEEDI